MFRPFLRSLLVRVLSSCLTLLLFGCDVSGSAEDADSNASCLEPACAGAPEQGRTCTNFASIRAGKYTILNNTWGIERSGVSGQQCIWSNCSNGSAIAWGTSYSWLGGPASQVESYTAAILGWHFGELDTTSGLPVQISANRNVTCTWNYRLTADPTDGQNVAYDIWLSPSATPGSSTTPSDEVMIWLHGNRAGPIGTPVDSVKLEGHTFTLYQGRAGSWNVYSFVRQGNTPCASLNLKSFFNHLVEKRSLDASKYVIGIEAGTEVFVADGQLETDYYGCEIE